jgi:hypothetical protein
MSKAVKKLAFLDPVTNVAVHKSGDPLAGKKKEEKAKAEAAAAAAATGAPSAAGVQKAAAMHERIGDIQSAAAAAGAVRSENEADVLGYGGNYRPKKRASKDLLGG